MRTEHWLVSYSKEVNESIEVHFLNNPSEDAVLGDIERFPHAFVLACCMDRKLVQRKRGERLLSSKACAMNLQSQNFLL